jgi:DNA-binding CsgD family transcriptional regulator
MAAMELWERSAALAVLNGMLRESATAGRVALIAGEAGIGKTALVRAFAAACGSRARVLWGICDPLVTPRASGPLHDIAHQLGGALAHGVSEGLSTPHMFLALVDELSVRPRTPQRVVVVEDVHWADEATLDMLTFLGRRVDRLATLLVVTYRDDEIGIDHPLRPVLAALPRQATRTVPMAPLSRGCVAEQAGLAGRDADEVFTLTGGNPLLVTELIATHDRSIPVTVRDLILARLGGLSRLARETAQLVSVIPTRAEAAVLAGIEEPVEECIAAGVLVSDGDAVAYRHELLRRAVEDSLSPARRASLHRRALALLARVEGTDPARLVHHARNGGDAPALLRYGLVAAAGAAAVGAHREAVAHYRAIRPYVARLPTAERAEVLEAYGFQAYLAGLAADGLEARRAALNVRRTLGEPVRVSENLRWISRLAWWSGEGQLARAAASDAVDALPADAPRIELAMAYSNLSQLHMLANKCLPAVHWGERARVLADRLNDPETSLHALINVSIARGSSGDRSASEILRRAYTTASEAGLVDSAARALGSLAGIMLQRSDYAAAAPVVDEVLEYAITNDLDGYVQHLLGLRATIRVEQCAWDAALDDAEASLGRMDRPSVAVINAFVARGRILAARGETGALSILDCAAERAYGIGEIHWVGPVASARAEYFLIEGDTVRAADEARRGLALALETGHPGHIGELSYRLWQATGTPAVKATGPAPFRLMMQGDWAAAAAGLAELGRGYTRLAALAEGDRPAAVEALAVLTELGAARATRNVQARLRRRGMTAVPRGPRPSTAANAAGLTVRQLEVLALLADGLSNTAIADRLTVSHRTVEHHVSAVKDKLAVVTRGEVIAAAHRLNLVAERADTTGGD